MAVSGVEQGTASVVFKIDTLFLISVDSIELETASAKCRITLADKQIRNIWVVVKI